MKIAEFSCGRGGKWPAWCLLVGLILVGCGPKQGNPPLGSAAETAPVADEKKASPAPQVLNYHQSPISGTADHWPAMTGPFRNSSSAERNLRGVWSDSRPAKLWSQPIGSGYSVPVVGREELYLFHRVGDEELIDCRDLQTGALRWQTGSPTAYECAVEYSDGPYSTPVLDAEHVYALGTEAKLYCLSRSTGDLIWVRDLMTDYEPEAGDFPVGSSPLLVGETLYLNLGGTKGDSTVVAIDTRTSETVWTALNDGRSYASPQYAEIAGVRHLFIFSDKYLSSLDPDNGQVRWQVEFGVKKSPNRVNAVTPLVVGDSVYVAAGPGAGALGLRLAADGSYREQWRVPRNLDSQFNNIVCVDNSLFGFTSKWNRQAQFRCLDRMTGDIRWEWPGEMGRGSIVVADGKFYLWGEDGEFAVLAIRHDQPELLYQTSEPLLAGPTYAAPVIADGKLLLRNEKELLAIDLSEQP